MDKEKFKYLKNMKKLYINNQVKIAHIKDYLGLPG